MKFNLLLFIYILMNAIKNYTTTHLRLSSIDMLEVVILSMTYLIRYVFQINRRCNAHVLHRVTGKNVKHIQNQKT